MGMRAAIRVRLTLIAGVRSGRQHMCARDLCLLHHIVASCSVSYSARHVCQSTLVPEVITWKVSLAQCPA